MNGEISTGETPTQNVKPDWAQATPIVPQPADVRDLPLPTANPQETELSSLRAEIEALKQRMESWGAELRRFFPHLPS